MHSDSPYIRQKRMSYVLLNEKMGKIIHFRAQCCWKYASHSKKLQMKVAQNWILYKKSPSAYVYLPLQWSWETRKIDLIEILNFTERQITFTLRLNAAKNAHRIRKNFEWKLFKIEFRTKKSPNAYVYLLLEIDLIVILNFTETPITFTHKWNMIQVWFN